jgi:hypothetical protein
VGEIEQLEQRFVSGTLNMAGVERTQAAYASRREFDFDSDD